MNSKPIKFTEVKDKRLLKATPMEREKLIFADNSYNVYVSGVGEIAVLVSDIIGLAPVVQRVDNAIHRINHYPVDSVVCFANTYPLDSDLSDG